MENSLYTSNLGAGTGLVEESLVIMRLWQDGMDKRALLTAVRESGELSRITDRRLKNIIYDQFGPRFLEGFGPPARYLKVLMEKGQSTASLNQLMFLFAARANPMLHAYVIEKYWPRYESGASELTFQDAVSFVMDAIDAGKTIKRWSEDFVKRRVAGYLNSALADFDFLENSRRPNREIKAPRITDLTAAYLIHELHFKGHAENGILEHTDWMLFGLSKSDVLEVFKLLAHDGLFIYQYSGEILRVSWKHKSMEGLIDVIA